MGCCGKMSAKITLVIGNSFFLVLGIALMALGSWIRYDMEDYDTILGSQGIKTPATLVIAGGAAVFLVAFLGFVGACRESKCLLLLYMVFVGIIVLVEISCVAVAFYFKGKAQDYVEDAVSKAIQETYGQQETITNAINDIQRTMRCCGAKGYKDYSTSKWVINHKNNATTFPTSCIDSSKTNRFAPANATGDFPFDKGCIEKMKDWAGDNLLIVGGMAAAVLFIELGGFLCAVVVYKKKHREVDVA